MQVVLSGFNVRLFCFVQAKSLCMYGCIYFLAAFMLVCVDCRCDGDVICVCCIGVASLNVVCDELNDCAWNVGL